MFRAVSDRLAGLASSGRLQPVDEFMVTFGLIANVITVVAGLVAIFGVVWAILGRAKLSVNTDVTPGLTPSLDVRVSSTGSNPVRDVELAVGALDDNGFALWGDGAGRRSALNRGESLAVTAFDDATTSFGSPPHEGEHRHAMKPGEGFYLTVQWRSPLFPWRRKSRTYAWPPALRFASRRPKLLRWQAESRFFKRAHDPRNSSARPGFTRPKWAPPLATVATDATFDELVTEHKGPVLVGFGPAWQGQFWLDVQQMLHAFAANYAPRVRVLIVTIEDCPSVASKYTTGTFPHFTLFRGGQVVASHDGAGSMPDVEAGLSPHLS
jgi:hypothetical protein